MPDRGFCYEWVVQRHYGGRCETVECADKEIGEYLLDLLQDPDKTHPDMRGRELTYLRVYTRVLDMKPSDMADLQEVVDTVKPKPREGVMLLKLVFDALLLLLEDYKARLGGEIAGAVALERRAKEFIEEARQEEQSNEGRCDALKKVMDSISALRKGLREAQVDDE